MHEPIKVAAMFLSGRGGVGYSAVPVPLGGKVLGSYVPVAPAHTFSLSVISWYRDAVSASLATGRKAPHRIGRG